MPIYAHIWSLHLMAEKKMAELKISEKYHQNRKYQKNVTENARIWKYQNWKMTELENGRM